MTKKLKKLLEESKKKLFSEHELKAFRLLREGTKHINCSYASNANKEIDKEIMDTLLKCRIDKYIINIIFLFLKESFIQESLNFSDSRERLRYMGRNQIIKSNEYNQIVYNILSADFSSDHFEKMYIEINEF